MTLGPPSPSWLDPASSWQAKAHRAKDHIDSLRQHVEAFRESEPYSIIPETTDKPGILAYRLRIHRPIPTTLPTILGDALHNMRAALECLAYELVRRNHSGTLTAKQEKGSKFPIFATPAEFDKFAQKSQALYGQRALTALRWVQPFAIMEQAASGGTPLALSYEESAKFDFLYRLNELWNIDKHRHLALIAWFPRMYYWMSNGPSNRSMYPGDGTMEDGSTLFYMEGTDEGMGTEVVHQFDLTITDDPAFRDYKSSQDMVGFLEQCWNHVCSMWVFPQIFLIMDSQP